MLTCPVVYSLVPITTLAPIIDGREFAGLLSWHFGQFRYWTQQAKSGNQAEFNKIPKRQKKNFLGQEEIHNFVYNNVDFIAPSPLFLI